MKPSELKAKLRGVIAFTPTPFTPDDRPDLDGLAKQVDFLVTSGATVVVAGVTAPLTQAVAPVYTPVPNLVTTVTNTVTNPVTNTIIPGLLHRP